ncbi:MAG: hypothetical protein R2706_20845 [Acidimicrobiales bacterium]
MACRSMTAIWSGVGDTEQDGQSTAVITYDLRCRRHWLEGLRRQKQEALFGDSVFDSRDRALAR